VKLESVELVRVKMPLVRPFRTSFGSQHVRDVLLVHVITDVSDGWGECAAHAEPFYNEEFVDASEMVLKRWLIPPLFDQAHLTGDRVLDASRVVKGYNAARASIEMAVLDAELRARGVRLTSYLGGVREQVKVGVSIGITDSIAQLVDVVRGYVADGYCRAKLKIEPGWDIAAVRAVREAFPDLALQVDANASYGPADVPHLAQLDSLEMLLIEQPFAVDDLASHAALASAINTPVCLDESILSVRGAQLALDAQACSVINIKVGRVGGLLEAKRIHDYCSERNVQVWCGGMLESGVGRAANVALATLSGFTLPGDISASERYFARDVVEPFVLVDSSLAVPQGAGLGVTVDERVLHELGATRVSLRSS